MSTTNEPANVRRGLHPFWNAVLRGLGVVVPPLLTIAIVLWLVGTIQQYVLEPVVNGVQDLLVWGLADIRDEQAFPFDPEARENPVLDGKEYQRLENGTYIPRQVYEMVKRRRGEEPMPRTGPYIYHAYVRLAYLRPYLMIPLFLCAFTLLLYVLGKLMAAGVGHFFGGLLERGIARLPLVRNVYSAVKQVSGFLLSERKMAVSRVVAVEYPRKGVWAFGFVTGQGVPQIEAMVGEECISVLICTSPMPMAGFTITIPRSEAIDLGITLDQAIQFIVSCGVIIPPPRDLKLPHPDGADAPLLAAGDSSPTSSKQ